MNIDTRTVNKRKADFEKDKVINKLLINKKLIVDKQKNNHR